MTQKTLSLRFRDRTLRSFTSRCEMLLYVLDFLIRFAVLSLLGCLWLVPYILVDIPGELSGYIALYVTAVFVWGSLLIKFLYQGKSIFGKTRFDLLFMGLLTLVLTASLLSPMKVQSVFGSTGMWSFSVITFLCISIIYYVGVMLLRYARGIKWLSLSLIVSVWLPGLYYMILVLRDESIGRAGLNYLQYAVLTIPLTLSMIFVFRKVGLKVLSFLSLICNVCLVLKYSGSLQGADFSLGIGVMLLLIVFYFAFWIKNSSMILGLLKEMKSIRSRTQLRTSIQKHRKGLLLLLMIVIVAGWIIGFAYMNFTFAGRGTISLLLDDIISDLKEIHGLRIWFIGDAASSQISDYEWINILRCYGLGTLIIYGIFFIYVIVDMTRYTLRLLLAASWRHVILASSLLMTICSLFVQFLVSRYNSFLFILFVLILIYFSIACDIMAKETYKLGKCLEEKQRYRVIMRYVGTALLIIVIAVGMRALLSGVDKGLFGVFPLHFFTL